MCAPSDALKTSLQRSCGVAATPGGGREGRLSPATEEHDAGDADPGDLAGLLRQCVRVAGEAPGSVP